MTISLKNHTLNTLSARDLEMVKHVTPGGNWTDIPTDVPSARLSQIREMSKERGIVRTTYYGRLRIDQPAYTIATYFNRPGNGTNIHPWEDRTITSREAARLQSFPDRFVFYGTEGAIRKQIGNAVPPLLAYAVGAAIGEMNFVDMFAGAGGLSYGLSMAGLECLVAQELDHHAISTYKANHQSNVTIVNGDISNLKVQNRLIAAVRERLGERELDLLAGGPPCQGFSTAGWRNHSDARNALVGYFLRIAEELKPKHILIENVEGLVNMGKGEVIRSIYEILSELGYYYDQQPWILNAEEYGVPQMRRRVFIIASKRDCRLPPRPTPIFDKCFGRREKAIHRETPKLSYPITVAEALWSIPSLTEVIKDYLPQEDVDTNYSDWCSDKIDIHTLLAKRGGKNVTVTHPLQLQLI